MSRGGGFHLTPCEILSLPQNATGEQAARARNRLAGLVHPDRAGPEAQAIMQLLNHAAEAVAHGLGQTPYVFGAPIPRDPGPQDAGRNGGTVCRCGRKKKPEYDTCFNCSPVDLCPVCQTRYYNSQHFSACTVCSRR